MDDHLTRGRILSIQSHVVHGYVGNKAAVFPLQCQGFEVDAIHTVHYSNHTGYPVFKGSRLNSQEFAGIVEALHTNQLMRYDAVLSGYVGQAEVLESLAALISNLKRERSNLVYALDPVMGDHGKFYVPPECLSIYKELLCPMADLIMPNQFEAERLTGAKVTDQLSAKEALCAFHSMGIRRAIITSCEAGPHMLALYASQAGSDAPGTTTQAALSQVAFQITFPKIEGAFSGAGDCASALLLGYTMQGLSLEQTCLSMLAMMQSLLSTTKDQFAASSQTDKMEMALIASRQRLMDSPTRHATFDVFRLEYL